jgi:hypothetical protein
MRPLSRHTEGHRAAARMSEQLDRDCSQRRNKGAPRVGDVLCRHVAGADPVPSLGVAVPQTRGDDAMRLAKHAQLQPPMAIVTQRSMEQDHQRALAPAST